MKKKSVISLILIAVMLFSYFPFGIIISNAVDSTAIYIVDSIGGGTKSIIPSENSSGSGWTWNADSKVLTLDGFNGEYIEANGDLTINLKGENRITTGAGSEKHAIKFDYSAGSLVINKTTSDDNDKLIINADGASSQGIIHGNLATVNGGTIILNYNSELDTGRIYGGYFNYGMYLKNNSKLVVDFEASGSNTSSLWGINTLYVEDNSNADIKVIGKSSVYGVESLYAPTGNGNIKIDTRTDSTSCSPCAIERLDNISETTTIDVVHGYVGAGVTWPTVFRIPSKIKVEPKTSGHSRWGFLLRKIGSYNCHCIVDLADGELITDGLTFTPQENEVEFKFEDSDYIDIPGGYVGNDMETTYNGGLSTLYLSDALKGINHYENNVTYEIIDGTLPKGLSISWGHISGTFEEATPAGTLTIKATRQSDNSTAEVTINYGEVKEKDRFLDVGGTKVNLKENGSGTGWNYIGDTNTLTLNGYNGGPIISEIGVNIILNGTNIITIPEGYSEEKYGISTDYYKGELTINKTSSDINDKLIITGNNIMSEGVIHSLKAEILGGTIDINVSNNGSGRLYGGYFNSGMFVKNNANINVTITGGTGSRAGLCSLHCEGNGNININCSGSAYVDGVRNLEVSSGSSNIVISAQTTNASATPYAINSLDKLSGTGTITVNSGVVCSGYYWSSYFRNASNIKVETKNSSKNWIILPIKDSMYWRHTYVDSNTGEPISDGLIFTALDAEEEFAFQDSIFFDIPEGKVGEAAKSNYSNLTNIYYRGGLRGISQYNNEVDYEIISGTLPAGLSCSGGIISGTYSEPCDAGEVTIRATRKSDNATADITINYGKVSVPYPIESVTLNKHKAIMTIGTVENLTATILPENATVIDVIWDTTDYGVARVEDGKVTAYKPGKAVITATSLEGMKQDSCEVYVREKTPQVYVNYETRKLVGFNETGTYKITGDGIEDTEVTGGVGSIDIKPEWYGKQLYINKLGDYDECISSTQWLTIKIYSVKIYDVNLGSAGEGYDADGYSNDVYFVNTSAYDLDPAKITTMTDNDYIIPYFNTTVGMLSAGEGYSQSGLFNVRPKAGLTEGDYQTTVGLLYDEDGDGTYETNLGSGVMKFKVSNKVTVTFNSNGHGEDPAPQVIDKENTPQNPDLSYVEGYRLIGWYLEPECENEYIGTPITEDITLYACWEAALFPDVGKSDWFYEYVKYVKDNGMMSGYTSGEDAGKFGPNDPITRGQIVTILYRREGQPAVSGSLNFADKDDSTLWSSNYYNNAILWASQNGIVTGYKDGADAGKFLPDKEITRAEFAIILQRYAKLKGISTTDVAPLTGFYDYDQVEGWEKAGLSWAVAKGIISGDKATTPPSLKPHGDATRAEAATMIMRFCNI